MDISKAALPPRQPHISEADRRDPLFREYDNYRAWCTRTLIEAPSFRDWKSCKAASEYRDAWGEHPRYPEFLHWMRANKGGDPKRNAKPFPENFKMWLEGARW